MRVVFMGTPHFARTVLEGLIENYEVVGVVTQPDKKVGRKQTLEFSPVKELALENNIKVVQPIKIKEDYQEIIDLSPDIIITCAYGQIIPKELLEYPKYKSINVHASLLPKLRGGSPIHKAIIEGYDKTGITIMYMSEKMDAGDIISTKEVEILPTDTLETLQDKLSLIGTNLLLQTLPLIINGTNKRIKQNEEEATFAYNITREEEHIDFTKTTKEVFNLIRGLFPEPSAYTILDNKEIKVYKAKPLDTKYNGECGQILDITKQGIIVKTKDASILIEEIKPFSKNKMSSVAFVNGIGKDKLIGKVFK